MLNAVILQGRLTKEPEIKSTNSGKEVMNFSIAVQDSYNRAQSYFIDCQAWTNNAKFISNYFHKGDLILIKGSLRTDSYTDKEGNNRKKYFVNVENVEFCGGKATAGQTAAEDLADSTPIDDDEDLPF